MRDPWERTPWYRRVNWWELIAGIVMIALGIASLARPSLAVTGLVYAYGAAGVIVGVADILRYIRVERYTGFGPMVSLVAGVLSVMAGVVILVNPRVGMAVFSLLFALWFITHCVSRLASLSLVRLVAGGLLRRPGAQHHRACFGGAAGGAACHLPLGPGLSGSSVPHRAGDGEFGHGLSGPVTEKGRKRNDGFAGKHR